MQEIIQKSKLTANNSSIQSKTQSDSYPRTTTSGRDTDQWMHWIEAYNAWLEYKRRLSGSLGMTCPPRTGPDSMLVLGRRKGGKMAKKRHTPEQVINNFREAEVAIAEGSTVAEAASRNGVTEQTFHRWRSEYGGLRLDQARRLKRLELENSRLKRAVADLTLDNQILREASE